MSHEPNPKPSEEMKPFVSAETRIKALANEDYGYKGHKLFDRYEGKIKSLRISNEELNAALASRDAEVKRMEEEMREAKINHTQTVMGDFCEFIRNRTTITEENRRSIIGITVRDFLIQQSNIPQR